ncbi:helix-turn-helix domain-containing protein (plasmid) [Nostoc sp. UHCC 0302]|uniref:helix-turn-helix domain-containing protein n=1 Tax=Nostoc sp. UHCC 0302 TaxID=3134896 RepID=UPI00311CCE62
MTRKWTEKELDTLDIMSEAYTVKQIAYRLKRQGFHRTPAAISQKLFTLGYSRKPSLDNYSCQQIAKVLNLDSSTVCRWVRKGWLKGIRRSARHWQVKSRDLKKFLKQPPPQVRTRIAELDKQAISYLVG